MLECEAVKSQSLCSKQSPAAEPLMRSKAQCMCVCACACVGVYCFVLTVFPERMASVRALAGSARSASYAGVFCYSAGVLTRATVHAEAAGLDRWHQRSPDVHAGAITCTTSSSFSLLLTTIMYFTFAMVV